MDKKFINCFIRIGHRIAIAALITIWTLVCLFILLWETIQATDVLNRSAQGVFNEIYSTIEQYEFYLTQNERAGEVFLYEEALNSSKNKNNPLPVLPDAPLKLIRNKLEIEQYAWASPFVVMYDQAPANPSFVRLYAHIVPYFSESYERYWENTTTRAPQTYLLINFSKTPLSDISSAKSEKQKSILEMIRKLQSIATLASGKFSTENRTSPIWLNINTSHPEQSEIWGYLPWSWKKNDFQAGLFTRLDFSDLYSFEKEYAGNLQNRWWLTSPDNQLLMGPSAKPPQWNTQATSNFQSFTANGLYFQLNNSDGWKMQCLLPYSTIWNEKNSEFVAYISVYVLGILLIVLISRIINRKFIRPITKQGLELIDSEAFNRMLINQAPIGLCVIEEKTYKIVHINHAAKELLGSDPRSINTAWLLQYAEDGAQVEMDAPRNGRELSIQFTKTRLHGEIVWLCGINDISAQKQIQQMLSQAKQTAERANEAKSAFLAMTSHEIRTPLFGLSGSLELLAKSQSLNEEQQELVDIMFRSARTLRAQIDDVLDFAKIEAGEMSLNIGSFSPAIQLQRVLDSFQAKAHEKGLVLMTYLDPIMPECLHGDTVRIEQILNNLVNNAIKFTDSGKIAVSWNVQKLEPNKVQTVLSVTDTGIGMDPEDAQEVFVPFAQMHQDFARYGGTGLGLPISQQLAKLMGSEISVQSTKGVGSKFTLPLTLEIASDEEVATEETTEAITENKTLGEGKRAADVLLVEDNPLNQEVLKRQLKELGVQPTIARDGEEALSIIQNHAFDLIISDINMPRMGGLELVKRIREKDLTTKIVALTAKVDKLEKILCLKIGFDDYFSKPINLKQLEQLLQLGQKNEQTELQKIFASISPDMQDVLKINMEEDLGKLEQAIAQQDTELIRQLAHRIKGAFVVTNLQDLVRLSSQMEETASSQDRKTIEAVFNELKQKTYSLWS